ncbi:hypothetical protein ANO14919_081420 [Xylariales sp. No.14919]|nr:hypothetical protein ANO14919_081420 [Xylariales sp. No.14919]
MESQTTLVTGVSPPPPYTERADLPEAQAEAQARMQEMRTWTEHLIARTRDLDRPSPSIIDALPLDLQGLHTDEPTAQGSQSSRSSQNADADENNDEDEKPAVMTGPPSANVSAAALDRAVPGTTDSVEISSTRCQSLKTGDAGSQKKKRKRKEKKGKKARGRDRGGSKKGKGEGEAKSDEAQLPSQSTTGPIARLIEKIKGLLGFASASTSKQSAAGATTTPSATATSTSREPRTAQPSSPEHAARMQRTDAWIDSVEHEATTICWIVVHQQETEAEAAPSGGEPGVQFVWGRDGRETGGWYRVP